MHTKPLNLPVPAPAAAADWHFVPSQTDRVIVMSVTALLTTAIAVANRYPALTLKDQEGLPYFTADMGVAQAASLAVNYCWARESNSGATAAPVAGQAMSRPFPDIWLSPGDSLGMVTDNLSAGDQWSNIVIRYYTGQRWLDLQAEIAEAKQLAQILTGQAA